MRHGINSGLGIEVVEIPDDRTGDERTFQDSVKIVSVIYKTIFLREVKAFRAGRMHPRIDPGTVFGYHKHLALVLLVRTVEQSLELVDIRLIPALIEVPSEYHRNLGQMGLFVS